MVTITFHCPHGQSEALVRNDRAQGGKQKYLCRACHRHSREDPAPHVYQRNTVRRSCVHTKNGALFRSDYCFTDFWAARPASNTRGAAYSGQ